MLRNKNTAIIYMRYYSCLFFLDTDLYERNALLFFVILFVYAQESIIIINENQKK